MISVVWEQVEIFYCARPCWRLFKLHKYYYRIYSKVESTKSVHEKRRKTYINIIFIKPLCKEKVQKLMNPAIYLEVPNFIVFPVLAVEIFDGSLGVLPNIGNAYPTPIIPIVLVVKGTIYSRKIF